MEINKYSQCQCYFVVFNAWLLIHITYFWECEKKNWYKTARIKTPTSLHRKIRSIIYFLNQSSPEVHINANTHTHTMCTYTHRYVHAHTHTQIHTNTMCTYTHIPYTHTHPYISPAHPRYQLAASQQCLSKPPLHHWQDERWCPRRSSSRLYVWCAASVCEKQFLWTKHFNKWWWW